MQIMSEWINVKGLMPKGDHCTSKQAYLFAKSYHILIFWKELKVLDKAEPQVWDPVGLPFLQYLWSWLSYPHIIPLRRRAGWTMPSDWLWQLPQGQSSRWASGWSSDCKFYEGWEELISLSLLCWVASKFSKWALPSPWLLSLNLCVLLPTVAASSIWCSLFIPLNWLKFKEFKKENRNIYSSYYMPERMLWSS